MTETLLLHLSSVLVYGGALLLSVGILWKLNRERIAAYFMARWELNAEEEEAAEECASVEEDLRPSVLDLPAGRGDGWLAATAASKLKEAPPALTFTRSAESEAPSAALEAQPPASSEAAPEEAPSQALSTTTLRDLATVVSEGCELAEFLQLCPWPGLLELPGHVGADPSLSEIASWPIQVRIHFLNAEGTQTLGGRVAAGRLRIEPEEAFARLGREASAWTLEALREGCSVASEALPIGVPRPLVPGEAFSVQGRALRVATAEELLELCRLAAGAVFTWPAGGMLLADALDGGVGLGPGRGPYLLHTLAEDFEAGGSADETQRFDLSLGSEALEPSLARTWIHELKTEGGTLVLGRGGECDLAFEDASVSRAHARLLVREGELHLSDVGSENGTAINAEPLAPGLLERVHPGDSLHLARVRCELLEWGELSRLIARKS